MELTAINAFFGTDVHLPNLVVINKRGQRSFSPLNLVDMERCVEIRRMIVVSVVDRQSVL